MRRRRLISVLLVLAALAAGSLVAFAHTALHHGQQSVFYLLLYIV